MHVGKVIHIITYSFDRLGNGGLEELCERKKQKLAVPELNMGHGFLTL